MTLRTANRLADASEVLSHLAEKRPPAVTPELDLGEFLETLKARYPWLTAEKLAELLRAKAERLARRKAAVEK